MKKVMIAGLALILGFGGYIAYADEGDAGSKHYNQNIQACVNVNGNIPETVMAQFRTTDDDFWYASGRVSTGQNCAGQNKNFSEGPKELRDLQLVIGDQDNNNRVISEHYTFDGSCSGFKVSKQTPQQITLSNIKRINTGAPQESWIFDFNQTGTQNGVPVFTVSCHH